ncbi:hypothetical protein LOC71_03705 [Rhodopirellula sp. JC740]|uniref:Transmembrane protein n=1 Tax=Rhodopirellula halodulae TaxID=2894198 RepID=A0ABS8NCT6_9BACT|nr:hypothetical protein [Rhodopirellula sp. JC740]MCC9641367.1 hypothetical protein [Rhodopirellula sp. JC740]
MSLDKFQRAWKADASQLKVTFDSDLLSQTVQQSDDRFRTMIFWRDVREVGTALFLIPIWFALGIGLSLPWSWWLTVPVLLWIAGFLLIDRKRNPKSPSEPGQPLLFYAREALDQVEHQVWLLRNVFWWYLLPFTVSLMAFWGHLAWDMTGTWWGSCLITTPLAAFLFYVYRRIYWLNQDAVRDQLLPRQEQLRKLVGSLESDTEADAGDVDELIELVSSLSHNLPTVEQSPEVSAWFENWNRIVPSWWIASVILLPTLLAAYCGYYFAFEKAGPVFFQSVVSAVVVFEVLFFGRWYIVSKRFKVETPAQVFSNRLGYPAVAVLVSLLVVSALAFAAIFSFVGHANAEKASVKRAIEASNSSNVPE